MGRSSSMPSVAAGYAFSAIFGILFTLTILLRFARNSS
jgi:hypothetical protein